MTAMIKEFVESWELFYATYLAGWVVALVCSWVGVAIVARRQVFLSMAVSQCSALGIAVLLWLGALMRVASEHWIYSDRTAIVAAIIFAVAGMWLGGRNGNQRDAIAGWLYLFSAALSIVLVAHSPHGLEEVQRLFASSLIGATLSDVYWFVGIAFCVLLLLLLQYGKTAIFLLDPDMGKEAGINQEIWEAGYALLLGIVIGMGIHACGILYTFGMIVLPVMLSIQLAGSCQVLFWLSPMVALLGSAVAFIFANHYDYPPGQLAVALLAALYAGQTVIKKIWRLLLGVPAATAGS